MRLSILLKPKHDFDWNASIQHKVRGMIWDSIKGTKFEELHGTSEIPTFTFSNIFPIESDYTHNSIIEKDQETMLLISSPHPGLLDSIAADINSRETLEIGDLVLSVDGIESRDINVGRDGSTGKLKTQTGLYIPITEEDQNTYNIDTKYTNSKLSWTPNHGINIFRKKLLQNSNWKATTLDPTIKPIEDFNSLFDSVQIKTTFEANVNVSSDYTYKFIPSVCELNYTIHTQNQRKYLNTLLDTGLGWRNALGFGFLNKIE